MEKETTQKPFEVLKIDEMVKPGEMGRLVKYYRHTIKTKGGVILSVNIDEGDFAPEKARPILEKQASNADKILSL